MKFSKLLIGLLALASVASEAHAQVLVPGNGAANVNVAAGKSLTVNNTLTLSGTDGTTMTFPSTSDTVAGLGAANSFTGTINTFGIVFSSPLGGNPVTQQRFISFTAASVSAGTTNVFTSAASRRIFPGNGTIMVSGTASGATNVVVECSPSGNVITTIPIAALVDGRPITFDYSSSASAASATPSKAMVAGCSAADNIIISGPSLATTTQVFLNLPYVVQ